MVNLVVAAISATTLYVLWRVFRNYLVAYPMDNLPGPAPSSFLFGGYLELPLTVSTCLCCSTHTNVLLGNLPDFSGRQAWKRIAHLAKTYGPAVTLRGILWVCCCARSSSQQYGD